MSSPQEPGNPSPQRTVWQLTKVDGGYTWEQGVPGMPRAAMIATSFPDLCLKLAAFFGEGPGLVNGDGAGAGVDWIGTAQQVLELFGGGGKGGDR